MIPGFEQTENQLDTLTVRGDLISRQAAIDAIKKDMYADKDYMSAIICEGIENVLNSLPTAEPERKRGKWIKEPQTEDIYLYRCSACLREAGCGGWHHMWFNYCPNCGAKMEDSDED